MRNWTPEQRQHQRELIQRWKPWEKSTGARHPKVRKGQDKTPIRLAKV